MTGAATSISATAIAGIGQTDFARDLGRDERELALDAIARALADAGVDGSEVDGLVRFDLETTTEVEIARNIGAADLSFFATLPYGGGAACATVALASMAVATGRASVVVCWRSRNRGSGGRPWASTGNRVGGDFQYTAPYGLVRPVDQVAMLARRHMHEFGSTREQLGAVAVAFRAHAARNPAAMQREPLAMADYLDARPVAEPLGKLDCCLESDGAVAVVVTSLERARDLRQPPVHILSSAQASGVQHTVMTDYYGPRLLQTPAAGAAKRLFDGTGVAPGDVDCAQFYDAFTPLVVFALEEYGFAKPGRGAAMAASGALAWPDGELPSNTSGGSLSEAYVHGMNLVTEGVRQIRGTSTSQVDGARVCLVSAGNAVPTSALLLASP